MDILPGFKLCRKKLHQYHSEKRQCPECQKQSAQNRREKNKEKDKEYRKNYYLKNKEYYRKHNKQWRSRHKNKRDKYTKNWKIENKPAVRAYLAKRRAAKKTQTPAWADLKEIARIYKECPPGYHVDHIYPLSSPIMCGLHVENNLQYLPALENIRKGNRVTLQQQLKEA